MGKWLLPNVGVGFCSSHWGSVFQCNFPLGKWLGHWSLHAGGAGFVLPAEELGFKVTSHWGNGWVIGHLLLG